jgi:hypothetical protein
MNPAAHGCWVIEFHSPQFPPNDEVGCPSALRAAADTCKGSRQSGSEFIDIARLLDQARRAAHVVLPSGAFTADSLKTAASQRRICLETFQVRGHPSGIRLCASGGLASRRPRSYTASPEHLLTHCLCDAVCRRIGPDPGQHRFSPILSGVGRLIQLIKTFI